ncbi:dehydrogenase [Sulfolobales archaeon HS-7]|nr:dehydrogenase [Sulfolobales archaeon HS-7]
MRIGIIGGGVAGSLAGALLSEKGYAVTVIDPFQHYIKPCGDVVPNVYYPKIKWPVKYEVKKFLFKLDGEEIYSVNYRYPKWLVIDKGKWIDSMRSRSRLLVASRLENVNEGFDLILDSRGPYPMDRKVVYTTRVIMKVDNFDDTAVFEFNTSLTGFYWIFPDEEGIINVGAGFLEYPNSRELVLSYIKRNFKNYEILDLRGAPISISEVNNKQFRIGEARGLVFPLSGEGIRPSAISAEIASDAIAKGDDLNIALDKGLSEIEKRIRIQRILLRIYRNMSINTRRTLVRKLMKNEVLIDAYLEDKIDLAGIAESVEEIKNGVVSRKLQ